MCFKCLYNKIKTLSSLLFYKIEGFIYNFNSKIIIMKHVVF